MKELRSQRIAPISFQNYVQTLNGHRLRVKICRATFALRFRDFPEVLEKAKKPDQYAM
jgi:hypothetical protein